MQIEITSIERNENSFNFVKKLIDTDNIEAFGISNEKILRTDGSFKKWMKQGYVRVGGQEKKYIVCDKYDIDTIKQVLKGKYIVQRKTNLVETKYIKSRNFSIIKEAIDWEYVIEPVKLQPLE